jgi:hypothetical protein
MICRTPEEGTLHSHRPENHYVFYSIKNYIYIFTYRASYRHMPTKLVPKLLDRGCHVVSVTDPYDSIPGFLNLSRYLFLQVARQLYSRGRVDPVPDPVLTTKPQRRSGPTWVQFWDSILFCKFVLCRSFKLQA